MSLIKSVALFVALASTCSAQEAAWAQCGGQGFTGATTCVAGYACTYSNPYYSQCLPASSTPTAQAVTTLAKAATTVTTSAKKTTTSTSPATSSTLATSSGGGVTYKASFTHYGSGDSFGSPNCQTTTSACGFYTSPGYAAAVSQNLFGVGPGAGAGPACGTCWKLVGETDSSGNALSNAGTSIIVMVNNLCPASGNPLCSQNGLSGTNQYGANVNFDLCSDSGAETAFFGNDGEGLAVGTATEVPCSEYSGTVIN